MLTVKKILLGVLLGSISISVMSTETTTDSTVVDLGKCSGIHNKVHVEQRCTEAPEAINNDDLSNVVSGLANLYWRRNGSTVYFFNKNTKVYTPRVHMGLDLASDLDKYNYKLNSTTGSIPEGKSPIYINSASDGVIVAWKRHDDIHTNRKGSMYGNLAFIKHFGVGKDGKDVYTLYVHMADPNNEFSHLKVGSIVKKGQKIGVMYNGGDSAGDKVHLHYAIQYYPDIGESGYYNRIYPALDKIYKKGDDKSGTIHGKKYNDVLDYFREIYLEPETFKFNHTPNLQEDLPYVIGKKLESVGTIPELVNSTNCASIWNGTITSSIAGVNKGEGNYQSRAVNGECVYKKNDEEILIRFNLYQKKSYIYYNSEVAGTKFSDDEFSDDNDTMKELYESYLDLFNTSKDPVFSELDLDMLNRNLINNGENIEQCVSIWNTESVTSLTASSTDETSDVYVDSDGKNCIFISTTSDDYIYFNYKDEVKDFVLGNQKPIHDKLFSRQKITSELQQKAGSGNLDCETSVSSIYLPSCQFINKHGQYQINYFHSPHHRADRMPQFFYFKASVDGEDKYVYLSSDGQYAVVYKTDMSSFIVVLNSDPIFKSLKDFKYPIEGYSEKLKLLFNIGEDKKFLNYQNVKVSDGNFVECANAFISKDKQASCGNNVIDSDEECASIWRASFYHSDSFNGYTSTLAKNNICHYTEEKSGKTIVYDANNGHLDINLKQDEALLGYDVEFLSKEIYEPFVHIDALSYPQDYKSYIKGGTKTEFYKLRDKNTNKLYLGIKTKSPLYFRGGINEEPLAIVGKFYLTGKELDSSTLGMSLYRNYSSYKLPTTVNIDQSNNFTLKYGYWSNMASNAPNVRLEFNREVFIILEKMEITAMYDMGGVRMPQSYITIFDKF